VVARRLQPSVASRLLHAVADGGEDLALANALVERYGKRGEETLPASALGLSREALAVLNRDRDRKLSKEMLAYFDRIESLRPLAERSCVSLVFSPEGRGLFGLLDGDGDGRLSVRELRNAHQLLARLDADGDGRLAREEVPRHYRGELTLGSGGGDRFGRVAAQVLRRPARGRGPLWFQKMDRNRDGDVSRKEFIGTDE
jgi:hypothetical protein